jgi:gamma-glutamylcyclotransferase (GGCT)/AIG2-like uncharacterized protein YtfP
MPSQEPIHLFVYGTLTDQERVAGLTGKQFERVDATLSGFVRVDSRLGYPFILPETGTVVRGVLLLEIDPVSLVRLDAYEAEGDLYRRQRVVVTVAGTEVSAETYVGHAIRASVTPIPARWTDSSPPYHLSDANMVARHRCAPGFDEH